MVFILDSDIHYTNSYSRNIRILYVYDVETKETDVVNITKYEGSSNVSYYFPSVLFKHEKTKGHSLQLTDYSKIAEIEEGILETIEKHMTKLKVAQGRSGSILTDTHILLSNPNSETRNFLHRILNFNENDSKEKAVYNFGGFTVRQLMTPLR